MTTKTKLIYFILQINYKENKQKNVENMKELTP